MSEIRKQLTMKAASEIFKLAAKLNIKPKDIIGMGGDIVKMGQSLFTEKVNPKLLKFVQKKGDVPPKIVEEIKIHLRSLKNASDNQIELFKLNLKDIVNAKFPPKADIMSIKSGKEIPVAGIKQLETNVGFPKGVHPDSEIAKSINMERSANKMLKKMSNKEIELRGDFPTASDEAINKMLKKSGSAPAFGSRDYYISEIKKTGKTVDTTNKTVDELKEILYRLDTEGIPFSDGGVAKLNAELNQLPEYYLPMAEGGIANHFRKK